MTKRMKNLFPKITTKTGGYTARIRFMDEARGELYFDTEFGVLAYQTPGTFMLTIVTRHDGGFTETTAQETIGQHLRAGDQVTVLVQRWSMRGRAKQTAKTIHVHAVENVKDTPGFVLVRYGYEPAPSVL